MDLRNLKNKDSRAFLSTAIGCGLFIVLTIIGMFTYPGGHFGDPTFKGYNFFNNFFSDLGITQSHSGESNLISHALFSISILLAGFSLIPTFVTLPKYFNEKKGQKWVSLVTSGFIIIIAFFYIGIGFTPANLYSELHLLFVMLAFPGTVPVIGVYAILFLTKKEFPKYLAYVLGVFFVIAFGYMVLLFNGPGMGTPIGLLISVVGQKIIIYTEMISMIIVTYGLANYLEKRE